MERVVLKELLGDFAAQVLEALYPALIEVADDLISNEAARRKIDEIISTRREATVREAVFPSFYYQIGHSDPVLIERNPIAVKVMERIADLSAGPGGGGGKPAPYLLVKKALQVYGKLPARLRTRLVKLGVKASMLGFRMRCISLEEIERQGIPGVRIHPKALCWTMLGTSGIFRAISSCGMVELNVGGGWSEQRRDNLLTSMVDLVSPVVPASKMLLYNTFHPEEKTRLKLFAEEFKEKAPAIMESSLKKYGYFNLVETQVSSAA